MPSNIAEGAARESKEESAQFLVIARASLSEIETQLILSSDLGYLSGEDYNELEGIVNTTFALVGGGAPSLCSREAVKFLITGTICSSPLTPHR